VDVPKVARPQAVDQIAALLDSPEITRLVKTIEYVRWTGRPGYPVRGMIGMCLVKSLYVLPTWSRTVRLVAEHSGCKRFSAVPRLSGRATASRVSCASATAGRWIPPLTM
jgi:hypothetical protein